MLLLRWTGSTPDMTTLYLAAMDALYKACHLRAMPVPDLCMSLYMQCWWQKGLGLGRPAGLLGRTAKAWAERQSMFFSI